MGIKSPVPTGRFCGMEVVERNGKAMLSDLVPFFAALNQRLLAARLT
jgi:hypothetical protein